MYIQACASLSYTYSSVPQWNLRNCGVYCKSIHLDLPFYFDSCTIFHCVDVPKFTQPNGQMGSLILCSHKHIFTHIWIEPWISALRWNFKIKRYVNFNSDKHSQTVTFKFWWELPEVKYLFTLETKAKIMFYFKPCTCQASHFFNEIHLPMSYPPSMNPFKIHLTATR